MNLDAVMDEVAGKLEPVPGLRVTANPADKVYPPHAVVSLPEITFDEMYGRGGDRFTLPVVLAVGKVIDRAARKKLAPYVAGTGPKSLKQALEGTDAAPQEYESCDSLRVQSISFDTYAWGAIEYLVAIFTLDIAGDGA
ncbi:MAG: hypothetical protein HOV78_05150 [Hamadaea sp.]|nr:hypothetical protein [Hamadaea sp.]